MIDLSDQSYAMPVYRDIPVTVNVEKLLRYEGNTDHGMIVETATWAAETTVKLSKPAIAYRYLPVEIAGKQLNICGVFFLGQPDDLINLIFNLCWKRGSRFFGQYFKGFLFGDFKNVQGTVLFP